MKSLTKFCRNPLADRGLSQPRTLDSLQRDHLQFCTKGKGNLKNAKFNNNVIGKALFHIPLTQVSVKWNYVENHSPHTKLQVVLPGLHISLGIFLKLWQLMERECHKLDLQLAQETRGVDGDRARFLNHSSLIHEISELEDRKVQEEQYARTLDSACTSIALQLGDGAEQNALLLELRREAVRAQDSVETTVSCIKCTHLLRTLHIIHRRRRLVT